MTKRELQQGFDNASDDFAMAVHDYLKNSSCDAEVKMALDEIARQTFYAIRETQKLIIKYLDE